MKRWWKYVALERLRRLQERVVVAVAWAMPRKVAYWCAIRVGVHGASGPWEGQVVPELTVADALKRWG